MSLHSEFAGCNDNALYVDPKGKKKQKEIDSSLPSIQTVSWNKCYKSRALGYPRYRLQLQKNE